MIKVLFFLVVIANVSLFMWEYKTGAWVASTKTTIPTDAERESIRLIKELKNELEAVQKSEKSAPVLQKSTAMHEQNAVPPPDKQHPVAAINPAPADNQKASKDSTALKPLGTEPVN
jgi:hypothetical protein